MHCFMENLMLKQSECAADGPGMHDISVLNCCLLKCMADLDKLKHSLDGQLTPE